MFQYMPKIKFLFTNGELVFLKQDPILKKKNLNKKKINFNIHSFNPIHFFYIQPNGAMISNKLLHGCDAQKPGGAVDNLSTRGIPMDFG